MKDCAISYQQQEAPLTSFWFDGVCRIVELDYRMICCSGDILVGWC